MEIKEALTDDEILACFPVVNELRPHINCEKELVRQVKLQKEVGYRLMYIKDQETNNIASICGFRITHYLYTGKTLYIDDLCTLPFARGRGHGGALLDWIRKLAIEEKCDVVSLDSGYTRNTAHRLYLNSGFELGSHHFVMKLK